MEESNFDIVLQRLRERTGERRPVPFVGFSQDAQRMLKYMRRKVRLKKGVLLIIPAEGDRLELPSFLRQITDELALGATHIWSAGDPSTLWRDDITDCAKSLRGIALRDAEQLEQDHHIELNQLFRFRELDLDAGDQQRLIVAVFRSRSECLQTTRAWKPLLRNQFATQMVEWPPLKRRKLDIVRENGLIDWALGILSDARHSNRLRVNDKRECFAIKPKARATLAECSRTVRDLFERLTQAALAAGELGTSIIDIDHLCTRGRKLTPTALVAQRV